MRYLPATVLSILICCISAKFSAEANFREATFSKEAKISSCRFKESTNFGGINFLPDSSMVINFTNVTGFSNTQMEWEYNPEKFGEEKDSKNIKGRGLRGHLKYDETFYIALIKNYKDMGWFSEADDCFYTYRVEKRKHRLNKLNEAKKQVANNPFPIGQWWPEAKLHGEWLLLDLTFGYGVKPTKIFWTFVVFWVFFILVYYFLLRHQWRKKQLWIRDLHKRLPRAIVFSLDTLTPGVNFRSEATLTPYTFNHSDFRKPIFNFCIRFQQILGWYWAALFLILFSKIWIR